MDLITMIRQYVGLKQQVDTISAREKELKKQIQEKVVENGEQDDKGSFILPIDDSVSNVSRIINRRRVSKQFDPDEAERILQEKGLLERCTTMVPMLDENEILAARYEDLLTDEDIDAMFPGKESFAFIVEMK